MSKRVNPKIDILNESSRKRLTLNHNVICRCIRESLRVVGVNPSGCEISLYFVDDIRMRELNREFRSLDRTTDVLSFPQYETGEAIEPGPDGVTVLGDVVVSLQTLERRCRNRGDDPGRELARVLVHGMLHLVGFDHDSGRKRSLMQQLEGDVIDTILGKGL